MKKLGLILLNSLIVLNMTFSTNCCAMDPQQQQRYGISLIRNSDFLKAVGKFEHFNDEKLEKVSKLHKLRSFLVEKLTNKKEILCSKDIVDSTDIFRNTDHSQDSSNYSVIFDMEIRNLHFSIILSDIMLHHIVYGNYSLEKITQEKFELKNHTGGHTKLGNSLLEMIRNSDQLNTILLENARNHIEKSDYIFDKTIKNEAEIVKLIQKILSKLKQEDFYDNAFGLQQEQVQKKKEQVQKKDIYVYVKIKNIGYCSNLEAITDWALLILKHENNFPYYDPRILYKVVSFYPVRDMLDETYYGKICIYIKDLEDFNVSEILKDGQK